MSPQNGRKRPRIDLQIDQTIGHLDNKNGKNTLCIGANGAKKNKKKSDSLETFGPRTLHKRTKDGSIAICICRNLAPET